MPWTWKQELVEVLKDLGGEADLSDIYKRVYLRGRKKKTPQVDATIRGTLESYCPDMKFDIGRKTGERLFYHVPGAVLRSGRYGLIEYGRSKTMKDNTADGNRSRHRSSKSKPSTAKREKATVTISDTEIRWILIRKIGDDIEARVIRTDDMTARSGAKDIIKAARVACDEAGIKWPMADAPYKSGVRGRLINLGMPR
jgi:hypothetical protein